MHELAITQSMFDIVLQYAEKYQAQKVVKINLVIGKMTGVLNEGVEFYLEFLTKNTLAEGAEVNIKTVPTKARCYSCNKTFELQEFDWKCPNCENNLVEIISGKELFVESIEVE